MEDHSSSRDLGKQPVSALLGADFGGLHPATRDLVERFARALAEKLAKAEAKYGYTDGWLSANWEADCREALLGHIDKGDPRDVAAYCAFMWHHGWPTSVATSADPMMGALARLAARWEKDVAAYPNSAAGLHTAIAVQICANELRAAIHSYHSAPTAADAGKAEITDEAVELAARELALIAERKFMPRGTSAMVFDSHAHWRSVLEGRANACWRDHIRSARVVLTAALTTPTPQDKD